jgi:hypothetical protein
MARRHCCFYTVLFGPDRDLAARSLWSYRHHDLAASIVAVCLDGPTATLERAAARHRIELLDVPEARLSASRFGDPYLTAVLGRFVDVPRLLPPASLYVMIDADTLCLRPPPVEALYQRMAECEATFAAAPEVSPTVGQAYLRQCRRIFDAFYLTQVAINPAAIMVNAGVVAWRPAAGRVAFLEEYAACLHDLEDVEGALFMLPAVDQVILNVLAQRHAGSGFHLLDSAWNERRAFVRHSTMPDWPATGMREDAIIWHCRNTFNALCAARYPEQVAQWKSAAASGAPN